MPRKRALQKLHPGAKLRKAGAEHFGTLGCFLRDHTSATYALTCEHTLTGGCTSTSRPGDVVEYRMNGSWHRLGVVAASEPLLAARDNEFDCAIIRVDPSVAFQPHSPHWPKPISDEFWLREDLSREEMEAQRFCKHGAVTGFSEATYSGYQKSSVEYRDGSIALFWTFELSPAWDGQGHRFDRFAQSGNSGAFVFHMGSASDPLCRPFGLLISVRDDLLGRGMVIRCHEYLKRSGLKIAVR